MKITVTVQGEAYTLTDAESDLVSWGLHDTIADAVKWGDQERVETVRRLHDKMFGSLPEDWH